MGNGLRRVTFLLVQKSNQKTRQGGTPWNPGLANSLRLEQSSPGTRGCYTHFNKHFNDIESRAFFAQSLYLQYC